ncbi:MAG: DUF1489 domain-containing protein [Pseudomonadota bacterium]
MIHMVKLCVGADDVADLENWQKRVMQSYPRPVHHTRMIPKRGEELADGGSIYWVIRGLIQVRQEIIEVKQITDRTGRKACELVFNEELIGVEPTPKRPFQGWRYLKPEDAPADLRAGSGAIEMPANLRAELREAMVW